MKKPEVKISTNLQFTKKQHAAIKAAAKREGCVIASTTRPNIRAFATNAVLKAAGIGG